MKMVERLRHKLLPFLVTGFYLFFMLSGFSVASAASALIVDYSSTNITAIPREASHPD